MKSPTLKRMLSAMENDKWYLHPIENKSITDLDIFQWAEELSTRYNKNRKRVDAWYLEALVNGAIAMRDGLIKPKELHDLVKPHKCVYDSDMNPCSCGKTPFDNLNTEEDKRPKESENKCKPMYDTDNEENLFIDDLLKFHKSEQMYNKETVIHIIKQVLMYNKNKP